MNINSDQQVILKTKRLFIHLSLFGTYADKEEDPRKNVQTSPGSGERKRPTQRFSSHFRSENEDP